MEQEIHFTNKDFDFSSLSISQPIAVQGGAYFTKIKYDSNPFYIQTPKCLTKQGINETNKKANDYKITSVPKLILTNGNSKTMYKGNRSYNDIMRFLKENGVNLIDRTFEDFDDEIYKFCMGKSKLSTKIVSKLPA